MDFLTHLSIRYTESGGKLDEEDPEETGGVVGLDSIILAFNFRKPFTAIEAKLHAEVK